MKKNKLLILIMIFLLIPIVYSIETAEVDFIFKRNQTTDLKIPCFDGNNDFCSNSTNCTATIHAPNMSTIVSFQNMTHNPSFFNYTMGNENLTQLGDYLVIMQCEGTNNNGQTQFKFQVTIDGGDTENKASNSAYIAIIIVLIFLTCLVIGGLLLAKSLWLKTTLSLALSLMIMITMRFVAWFVEILTPLKTEMIQTLNRFYQFSIWGFRMTLIAAMFILLLIVLDILRNAGNRKPRKLERFDDL